MLFFESVEALPQCYGDEGVYGTLSYLQGKHFSK